MEYGYSIIMFCMAGALVLYAGLLALVKDPMLIPRHYAARMRNKKAYALMFAKIIAMMAMPFAASGIVGLIWNEDQTLVPAIAVLIIGFIACLYLSTKIARKSY